MLLAQVFASVVAQARLLLDLQENTPLVSLQMALLFASRVEKQFHVTQQTGIPLPMTLLLAKIHTPALG